MNGFTYDGRHCSEFNLELISSTNGLKEDKYFSSDNLKFELEMCIIDENNQLLEWTLNDRREINNWLYQDKVKPLKFDNEPDVIYYCKLTEGSKKLNGIKQGYIKVTMECNSQFAYLNRAIADFDFSDTADTTIIEVENLSNVSEYYYPELEFVLNNIADFSIVNLSDEGREFKFTGLNLTETIYLSNKMKRIISDTNLNRYSNFNKNWLRLIKGINRLQISGNCSGEIRVQYPIII